MDTARDGTPATAPPEPEARTARRWVHAVVFLVLGFLAGNLAAGWGGLLWGSETGAPLALEHALDAAAAHPFDDAPRIDGTIAAGTQVRVDSWKGGVVYVDVEVPLDGEAFTAASGVEPP